MKLFDAVLALPNGADLATFAGRRDDMIQAINLVPRPAPDTRTADVQPKR